MASSGADKIGEDAQVNPETVIKNELPDRSHLPDQAGVDGELSKNAAKKAAKREKQAADKASKGKEKPIGVTEAKKPASKPAKKKIEGAALIGIDVAKEEDFSGWYQQVLTKGDMLDYYDVSGCYILKVSPGRMLAYAPLTFTARLILRLGASSRMVQCAH
jgi:prolyl-tRNA synthetase